MFTGNENSGASMNSLGGGLAGRCVRECVSLPRENPSVICCFRYEQPPPFVLTLAFASLCLTVPDCRAVAALCLSLCSKDKGNEQKWRLNYSLTRLYLLRFFLSFFLLFFTYLLFLPTFLPSFHSLTPTFRFFSNSFVLNPLVHQPPPHHHNNHHRHVHRKRS